jgi:RecA-family ATPase
VNVNLDDLDHGGHDGEQDAQGPSKLDKLRAALVDSIGLDKIPEPRPLIGGILFRDTLVWLQGKSGDGKSFVALDMAGCIGTGTDWQGYPVTQGKVLYVVAEGVSGTRWRVRAWEEAYGEDMGNVQWLPQPVQAGIPQDWDALVDLVREIDPILVIIDTQARVTVGMDENGAKDMGLFVEAADQIRQASSATVLVVHHEGRNGEHLRGSTALIGAASTVIRVVKDDDDLSVTCEKQKDAEPFPEIKLRMQATGDSVVLVPSSGQAVGKVHTAAMKTAGKWWETFKDDRTS